MPTNAFIGNRETLIQIQIQEILKRLEKIEQYLSILSQTYHIEVDGVEKLFIK